MIKGLSFVEEKRKIAKKSQKRRKNWRIKISCTLGEKSKRSSSGDQSSSLSEEIEGKRSLWVPIQWPRRGGTLLLLNLGDLSVSAIELSCKCQTHHYVFFQLRFGFS